MAYLGLNGHLTFLPIPVAVLMASLSNVSDRDRKKWGKTRSFSGL